MPRHTMVDTLLELIIIGLWIAGLRIATGEGMILYRVDNLAWYWLPKWAYKPLIGCAYCMSSVHGLAIHFDLIPLPLLTIVCAVPFAGGIIKLHDKI